MMTNVIVITKMDASETKLFRNTFIIPERNILRVLVHNMFFKLHTYLLYRREPRDRCPL